MSEQAIYGEDGQSRLGPAAAAMSAAAPLSSAASSLAGSAVSALSSSTAVAQAVAEPPATKCGGSCAAGLIPWPRVLSEIGGDARVLADLASAFREEGPQLMAQMQAAIATGGQAALWQAAHTLKGSLQIFHAEEMFHLAREVELLGHAGHLAAAGELLARLDAGVKELCGEMAAYLPAMK